MSDLYVTTAADVRMPRLIYGTAWKKERTAALVAKAIGYGFRGIDTACQPKHYHERGVGEALAEMLRKGIKRSDLFLQTKFTSLSGQDPARVPYDADASLGEQVKQSMDASLGNLGINYVDSLVLHSPMPRFEETREAWVAMEGLVKGGRVRQLGISNCYELAVLQKLYNEATVKPCVLQNRFYRDTGYDRPLRAWCLEKNIIYQSFWTLSANPDVLASPSLRQIAARCQKTEAQVFFRYLTARGVVPLTGTSSDVHMQEDLGIFAFDLSAEDLAVMDALLL